MKQLTNRQAFPITLFLAILFSSCCTSNSITRKYKQEAKKWEKDILKFEELDKSEKYPDDAIVFTGSSSIRLWSTIKEDMAPYQVIQRGFGGSKYSDLACYVDRIVYPHQFKALVMYAGNDIIGNSYDKTADEMSDLLRYIVKVVRKKNPDKPIFVVEITPNEKLWQAWPKIREANAALKKACEKLHNVYFIATASSYLTQNGEPKKELFRPDKLHQNREGYILWSRLIKAKLDEVLKK